MAVKATWPAPTKEIENTLRFFEATKGFGNFEIKSFEWSEQTLTANNSQNKIQSEHRIRKTPSSDQNITAAAPTRSFRPKNRAIFEAADELTFTQLHVGASAHSPTMNLNGRTHGFHQISEGKN